MTASQASFFDESINGLPLIAVARRAEIEEMYYVKKEMVRAMGPYPGRKG